MIRPAIDELFDVMDVNLQAFAVCEIGEGYSLQCAPHDEIVLHFVLQGEGHLECSEGSFRLAPGVLTVCPRHMSKSLNGPGPVRHTVEATPGCASSDGLLRFQALDRDVDLLLGCAVIASSIGCNLPLLEDLRGPIVVQIRDPALYPLLTAMMAELRRPGAGTRTLVTAIMKQLLVILLRSELGKRGTLNGPRPFSQQLHRAALRVTSDPGAEHSIQTLATEAAMSRGRFIKHFSAAYGCTPMAFVQTTRLASAAAMLRNSERPIKSIAAIAGYASRSQFSKVFRERYGQHPTAFRQAKK